MVLSMFGVLRRHLVVVAAGLLVTLGVCGIVYNQSGVYWSRMELVFLAPTTADHPNNLARVSDGLIVTAGLVETLYNWDRPELAKTEPEATIVGRGMYSETMVRLFDDGGQWMTHFSRPILDVQVSDRTPELVVARRDAVVAELTEILDDLQTDLAISAPYRTTMNPTIATPAIYYESGRPKKAVAMTLMLGTAGTVVAAFVADRRSARPARGRLAQGAPTGLEPVPAAAGPSSPGTAHHDHP